LLSAIIKVHGVVTLIIVRQMSVAFCSAKVAIFRGAKDDDDLSWLRNVYWREIVDG